MSRTDDERYAAHQRADCPQTWFHDGPCAPAALWKKPAMTDTTAPRTAAPLSADEEAKFRQSVALIVEYGEPAYDSALQWTNDAMARLLATLDIEREAIEPLLALVRAAQDVTARERDREWFAVTRLRDALAALPESVRVAARKPE
jgi:hypothetical protein